MNPIEELAKQAGFSACFVLKNDPFPHYLRRLAEGSLAAAGQKLVADPGQACPWSNALLLLLMAYRPYRADARVSGNYPSSNKAFHAANALIASLNGRGVRAERVYVPVRELALRSGVGRACLNGLTAYEGFGTRVAVQTLAVDVPDPAVTEPCPDEPLPKRCRMCGKCIPACPSGAIGPDGFDVSKCARAYMGAEVMPEWVMDRMSCLLGCELCQAVCPENDGVLPLDEALPGAFRLERLLSGDVKPALAIVGKNLNSGGRILAHACVMAARENRAELLPQLERLKDDARPAVAAAARYAISRLQER